MAQRHWVGGTNSWNATAGTKWSLTNGGAGGQAVPTSADDVFFDSGSGSVVVSTALAGSVTAKSVTCTGFTGTFSSGVGSSLQLSGDITLGTRTWPIALIILATCAISTGSGLFTGDITIGSTVTVTLSDAFVSTGALNLTAGTFNANNFAVTASTMNGSGSTARTITMGSGTWTLTSTGTVWDCSTTTNLTLNANTSTIKITDVSGSLKIFAGGAKTYANIWFSGAGALRIEGSNTFTDFKADVGGSVIDFDDATTTTVTTFTVGGSLGSRITMQCTTVGTWNLVCASGTISVSFTQIQDSHASGGATFTAVRSVDSGGNTGWRFVNQGAGMIAAF